MNKEYPHDNMTVEEILKSIKGVINNRMNDNAVDEDILELTEVAEENELQHKKKVTEEPLISKKSAAETKETLKHFVKNAKEAAINNPKQKKHILEEWIIEMMRPQLSKWLDENLPNIVKDLVEKEIKKLLPSNNQD